jgi:hypothetical protein
VKRRGWGKRRGLSANVSTGWAVLDLIGPKLSSLGCQACNLIVRGPNRNSDHTLRTGRAIFSYFSYLGYVVYPSFIRKGNIY